MGIFRRRKEEETLNEQMLREAGLDSDGVTPPEQNGPSSATASPIEPEPAEETADPVWSAYLTRAMERPAIWDVVTSITAPGIEGDKVEFATLPTGDLVVDTETGDADLSPFADAVEKQVDPPYRVLARREGGDRWGIAARVIDVVELTFDGGDEIELVENEGSTELRVDGEPWSQEIPELERAGETLGTDFVVQADRLDGDFWEIRVSAL
jgi:hypothetical protein